MPAFASDTEHLITIPSGKVVIDGILHIPKQAKGLVLFVHGSGSSRLSVRNRHVAAILNQANLATLLFDLFTQEEDEYDARTSALRFDIAFLASRLIDATDWCTKQLVTHDFNIGYFGASTGAAAALVAAAQKTFQVKAVVSRGGRPDLAAEFLSHVKAPTLLMVGENDHAVIPLNQMAFEKLHGIKKFEIVPHATHLFEEPGTLDIVAQLARAWFVAYLRKK